MCRLPVEEIFSGYGVPLQVINDQGREFDYKLVKGLCEIMGTDKIRTSLQGFHQRGCRKVPSNLKRHVTAGGLRIPNGLG